MVQVIREMVSAGGKFRVLALSATPGNDLKVRIHLGVHFARIIMNIIGTYEHISTITREKMEHNQRILLRNLRLRDTYCDQIPNFT